MTMRTLQSNNDLFEYLLSLAEVLTSDGERELANEVEFASRYALGSASEFLHYAGISLKKVRDEARNLDRESLAEVDSVIAQIETAFNAIGGA